MRQCVDSDSSLLFSLLWCLQSRHGCCFSSGVWLSVTETASKRTRKAVLSKINTALPFHSLHRSSQILLTVQSPYPSTRANNLLWVCPVSPPPRWPFLSNLLLTFGHTSPPQHTPSIFIRSTLSAPSSSPLFYGSHFIGWLTPGSQFNYLWLCGCCCVHVCVIVCGDCVLDCWLMTHTVNIRLTGSFRFDISSVVVRGRQNL